MEIENKIETKDKFGTLSVGDVFLGKDNSVYIVVDTDYNLGKGHSYDGYAVDLGNGWHYGFDNDEKVTKVSAKVTLIN